MTAINELKVFITQAHDCSYIEGKQATTLFLDPGIAVDNSLYSELADMGFRRSGDHIYRPHCQDCQACIPARISVDDFKAKRTQRRTLSKNRDLIASVCDDIDDDECYQLYDCYIRHRHADGDMFPPNQREYRSFLCSPNSCCRYVKFHLGETLVAVAVIDEMQQGLAAIYSFFHPDYDNRSLGAFMILWQIEEVQRRGLRSLYLGYWIKECQKMRYKSEYRPLELLINGRWLALS